MSGGVDCVKGAFNSYKTGRPLREKVLAASLPQRLTSFSLEFAGRAHTHMSLLPYAA